MTSLKCDVVVAASVAAPTLGLAGGPAARRYVRLASREIAPPRIVPRIHARLKRPP